MKTEKHPPDRTRAGGMLLHYSTGRSAIMALGTQAIHRTLYELCETACAYSCSAILPSFLPAALGCGDKDRPGAAGAAGDLVDGAGIGSTPTMSKAASALPCTTSYALEGTEKVPRRVRRPQQELGLTAHRPFRRRAEKSRTERRTPRCACSVYLNGTGYLTARHRRLKLCKAPDPGLPSTSTSDLLETGSLSGPSATVRNSAGNRGGRSGCDIYRNSIGIMVAPYRRSIIPVLRRREGFAAVLGGRTLFKVLNKGMLGSVVVIEL